ncbi:hypothetical protein JTB14_017108 [Gonioctena quinquepunctata]|nr:hypothetical protein JTB14_017108 [Gonioctena quinquepunctata]
MSRFSLSRDPEHPGSNFNKRRSDLFVNDCTSGSRSLSLVKPPEFKCRTDDSVAREFDIQTMAHPRILYDARAIIHNTHPQSMAVFEGAFPFPESAGNVCWYRNNHEK